MTKTLRIPSSTTALERGGGIFSFTAYLIKNKFVEEDYESVSLQSIRTLKQGNTSVQTSVQTTVHLHNTSLI